MNTVHDVAALRQAVAALKQGGKVAFVPTMGNLHAGHIRLMENAREHADAVVASIFVNPLQFGANEDLDRYPRTLAADQAKLEAAGVELLFAPSVEQMYPKPLSEQTQVEVPELGEIHCGASRPGHFAGVTTVVNKLFNMVQPDVALFGKKDFQQLLVIRHMVDDLAMPIEIIGVATERGEDGLALSSRNQYLTDAERVAAPQLYATLIWLRDQLIAEPVQVESLQHEAQARLQAAGFTADYLSVVDANNLRAAQLQPGDWVILAAAQLGNARLIDNLEFTLS